MKVLVDMLNIIFIEYHVARRKLREDGKVLDEENLPFYAHLLFNKLNSLFQTYGELEICWEGKNSLAWRREIFPEYKRNRDKSKTEDEYLVLKSFIPEIEKALNNYPCRQYKINNAEGDDVIYSLCKIFIEEQNEKVTVLSTDGDLVQLKNFWEGKVEVYNPIKRAFAKDKPNVLLEKAIIGDNSDNIPGLHRVGIKTFEKMLEDKNKFNEIIGKGNNKDIFKMFSKIVDLRNAPGNITEEVRKITQQPYNKFKPDAMELFFWEHKLQDNLKRWMFVKNEIYDKIEVFGSEDDYITEEIDEQMEWENVISPAMTKEADEEESEIDKILGEYT